MDRRGFLERSDGVAFWLMVFLCLALVAYFYIIAQRVNYLLLVLFIIGMIVSRVAWWMFAWRRPLTVEMEKAERVAFWTMSLISLAILTLEYVAMNFFDYYVFSIFVAGFLTKYVMSFFLYKQEKV